MSKEEELLCEHKGSGKPHFAHGLCETCYHEFIKISGGLDGGSEPPAFQCAERERLVMTCANELDADSLLEPALVGNNCKIQNMEKETRLDSSAEIKRDVVEVQTYVKRAFISKVVMKLKHCKFILAPYIQDNHWILIVIDLRLGIAFVFDPDTQPKEKPRPLNIEPVLHYAYKSYRSCLKGSALMGSRPNLVFNQLECAQQNGGTECGYYVMRYMYEIVAHHNDCKGNLQEDYMGRSSAYNDNEINKVREHWAKFFRTTILLK